jgi:exosortase E/protease (VPEID-CTERM system)
MLAAVKLSSLLYLGGGLRRADLLTASWFLTSISAIAFAAFAFLPGSMWVQLIRRTGYLWAYASAAVVSPLAAAHLLRRLWLPTIHLTFDLTKNILDLFVPGVFADPVKMVIGTPDFSVQILSGCSGIEGIGMILAFGVLWLLVFRNECRFPQAFALLPLGVAVIFLFNTLRIAALILIGEAGAPEIAENGFHSQAGWITFSAVSVGFCYAITRVPWFANRQPLLEGHAHPAIAAGYDEAGPGSATKNPAAAFLMPFVMILAAGMIAAAATGADTFEWLYPLQFFAAAGTLWIFRRRYANLNWSFDWLAPVTGALVFVIWIALDRASGASADSGLMAPLMDSPVFTRIAWLTIRVLAAVITVPLAEELAFRGFLVRRLISSDFESISLRRFSWFALLVSSVIFGILHGGFWLPGIIAGILFGLVMIRRGRIGDAVVAHASANALLAAYVLTFHKWHLW